MLSGRVDPGPWVTERDTDGVIDSGTNATGVWEMSNLGRLLWDGGYVHPYTGTYTHSQLMWRRGYADGRVADACS